MFRLLIVYITFRNTSLLSLFIVILYNYVFSISGYLISNDKVIINFSKPTGYVMHQQV